MSIFLFIKPILFLTSIQGNLLSFKIITKFPMFSIKSNVRYHKKLKNIIQVQYVSVL